MPIVTIQITKEGVTQAQKNELITRATRLLRDVLDKDPASTFVLVEEVDLENWGIGGMPVTQYRQQLTEA